MLYNLSISQIADRQLKMRPSLPIKNRGCVFSTYHGMYT